MERWLKLKNVLSRPDVYGRISESKVYFIPDLGSVCFSARETGTIKQLFERYPILDWYPVLYDGEVYLVSKANYQHYDQLELNTKIGSSKQWKVLEKYTKELFSNRELNAKPAVMTTRMLKKLPAHLTDLRQNHFVASTREHPGQILCATGRTILISRKEFSDINGVRPVVRLPDDIFICLTSEKVDRLSITRMKHLSSL